MSLSKGRLLRILEASVGREQTFTDSQEMGRAAFRMYAEAIQDANPLYTDHELAQNLGLKDVMAPPTLICDTFRIFGDDVDEAGHPLALEQQFAGTPLRAGNEYEFFQPVHPNDVVTLRRKVMKVWEKRGRSGTLVFQRVEVAYHNQRNELLAVNNEVLCYRESQQDQDGDSKPK